ncbi:hypothetical protein ABZW96_33260 [Nocardia sp. NPDC004168]|uniref:hypothetical protein n=1 Tax=Nocardia sp. NPDC004168 TaxID=3154452 RepID=UPI0033A23701
MQEEAFQHAGYHPRAAGTTRLCPQQKFLFDLVNSSSRLLEDSPHRPYYRERRNSQGRAPELTVHEVAREFADLIDELDQTGYFDKRFGDGRCGADGRKPGPEWMIVRQLRLVKPLRWPLDPAELGYEPDLFFSLIEMLHDQIARPRTVERLRTRHPLDPQCKHYVDFDVPTGQAVYRWRVNKILDRSNLGIRLAEEGEDIGLLVSRVPDVRADLVTAALSTPAAERRVAVEHAIALFRRRDADLEEKRSACIALAGLLEERRALLKQELFSADEGALFHIANKFNIRHRSADQHSEYDPAYLDWVFWWYLSTIELTDKLVAAQAQSNLT